MKSLKSAARLTHRVRVAQPLQPRRSWKWLGLSVGLGLVIALFVGEPGLSLAVSTTEYPIPTTDNFTYGIASGSDGNIWFTERGRGYGEYDKIGKITSDGTITEYPLSNSTYDSYNYPLLTNGPDGNLWFSEGGISGVVGKFNPVTHVVTQYVVINPDYANYRFSFFDITGGLDGNVWFLVKGDAYSQSVRSFVEVGKITPVGNVTYYAYDDSPTETYGGITSGPDGNLWFTKFVAQGPSKIAKITPAGIVTEYPFSSANSYTYQLTGGPDGNVWFIEAGSKIGKITPAGVMTEYPLPAGSSAYDITKGPDSNLWFTELSGKIGKITPTGSITEYPVQVVSGPDLLTSGPDGNLWFTESDGKRIGKLTLVLPPPPPPVPADLVGQLRVTPDRELGLGAKDDNPLVYSLTVKNIGLGRANKVTVRFPLDPQLSLGYVTSSDIGVWVEQVVTDTAAPYVQIGLPRMDKGRSHSLKVVMRAGAGAKAGNSLFTAYQTYWDDDSATGRSVRSNGVRLSLTNGNTNRNDTNGQVQLYTVTPNLDGTVGITGDFYAPGEDVDLWYTDRNRQSKELGRFRADASGLLSVTVSLKGWPSGQTYVITGLGIRTGIYGTGVIKVQVVGHPTLVSHESRPKRLQPIEVSQPSG